MAPMALSDSEVKTCSKTCLKNYEDLKSKYDKLRIELRKSESDLSNYKRGLASVEERLVFYKKNEGMLCDQIAVLKRDASYNESNINDKVIGSQLVDNNKKGLGYNVVPPPLTGLFAPPIIDLSHSGIEKFKEPEFVSYGVKVDKSVCEKSSKEIKKTPDAPIIEEWVSDDEEQDESPVVIKKKTVFPTAAKIEVVKPKQQEKPVRKPVKYAEMYSFNHLIKDCKKKVQKPIWNNARRVNHHNSHRMSYPHPKRNFVPKAVLMKTGMRPVNAAKPKAAYNAVKTSACWVWMPKNRMVDHVSKNISASVTLKRLDYIDAQGRFKSVMAWMDAQAQGRQECSKEKEESREECSKSRKTKKMKWEDCWELNTSELVLPRDELVLLSQQLVLLEENSSYCSRLQLLVLNQSVNTARGPKCQRFYGYAINMETSKEVYSKHRISSVTSLKIMEFFGYKHLEEIIVRRQDDKLYKFREGDFKRLRREDIKDMLLLLDLQLAVKSYQKKINLTKPDTYHLDISKKTPYTAYHDIQGIIYQDDMDRNRLMRINELHKFSDGTLNHVRTSLNDIATGIQMEYLPKRKWTKQDKQRAQVMINAIDKKLKYRRLMRSLEKFVGGRPYRGDLWLLQRTI
ncbi:hypothetical protein Tco_0173475 [Tanacetum coccineum]